MQYFWILVLATTAFADETRLKQIPVRMKAYVDRGEVSGVVTLVSRRGAVIHHEAVGWQDLGKSVPMKPDTIFEVMSMTKPVTAIAIQMLAEEGMLALNDPVEKHLPEFRGQMQVAARENGATILKKPSRLITIRDLLTHTSGLAEMPPEGAGGVQLYYRLNLTLASAVSLFSQMPLQFDPGTKWSYSNPGIATLGRIIEVVSGKAYEQFLDERVFQPLGMKDSFFFPNAERYPRIARAYTWQNGKLNDAGDGIYRKNAKYPMPEGGLYATARDMAAFYQLMLDQGKANGRRLLSPASVELARAVHTEDTARTWGLGWGVLAKPGSTLNLVSRGAYGHGGALGTYGWVDPAKEMVGVFMIQRVGGNTDGIRNVFVGMANAAVSE